MIRIMYVNHYVNNDYISNLYESKVTSLVEYPSQKIFFTIILFHVLYIFHCFIFLTNEVLMKKPWKTLTRLVFMNWTMESFK